MRRYDDITVDKRWDGKRVYKSTLYPTVPYSTTDILVIAGEGDYLDTLAFKYYKDPTLWWVIANVNNVGKGRMSVEPGTQLRIPTDISRILNDFKNINA
jgi:hypothetical protein